MQGTNQGIPQVVYDTSTNPRDALGRVAKKSETIVHCTTGGCSGTDTPYATYTYDQLLRLKTAYSSTTSETTTHYYDSDGNRTCATTSASCAGNTSTFDTQDRLLQSPVNGGTTYGYVVSGHGASDTLVSETVGSAVTTFTYDLLGNLRSYYNNGTKQGITYTIDGANRRVGRSKNINGTTTALQQFLYRDGRHIVAELSPSSGLVSAFSYGLRADVPDLMLRSAPATGLTHSVYRLITDQLGSVRLVVNLSTGAVVQRIDYGEYGVPSIVYDALGAEASFPNVLAQPFGFAGGLFDGASGLVRFGARDYDPSVGRWTAKDAIRFDGGPNLYAYTANDPVDSADPSGHLGLFTCMQLIPFGHFSDLLACMLSSSWSIPGMRDPARPDWSPPNEGSDWKKCLSLPQNGIERARCCAKVCNEYSWRPSWRDPDWDDKGCYDGCVNKEQMAYSEYACPGFIEVPEGVPALP